MVIDGDESGFCVAGIKSFHTKQFCSLLKLGELEATLCFLNCSFLFSFMQCCLCFFFQNCSTVKFFICIDGKSTKNMPKEHNFE